MANKYPQLSFNLKKLLFERNMKPIDLAREVDIPQPTIHRLVTGKSCRPYMSSLKPIADFFSLSVEQLVGETHFPSQHWQEDTKNLADTPKIKTIPLIDWAQTTTGVETQPAGAQYLVSSANISNDAFALSMSDSSMEPLFPKLTYLIFDPQRMPIDRSYVLVKLDGIETPIFRQLLIDIEHQYLKPLHPDLNIFQMRLLGNNDTIIATLVESRINHQPLGEPYLL